MAKRGFIEEKEDLFSNFSICGDVTTSARYPGRSCNLALRTSCISQKQPKSTAASPKEDA
jgi:hypothetical protein